MGAILILRNKKTAAVEAAGGFLQKETPHD